MSKLSPELLSVLRCPVTGSGLVQEGDELVSTAADDSGNKLRYRIEDGIPLLLRPELLPAATANPAASQDTASQDTASQDTAHHDPARRETARRVAAPRHAAD